MVRLITHLHELDPELVLLRLCTRPKPDGSETESERHLVQSPIDWPRLLRLATTQASLPLLHRQLIRMAPGPVPETIRSELHDRFLASTARNLLLARSLPAVLGLLGDAGVRALSYKGIPLAIAAYGDISLRAVSDLDIWVCPEDFRRTRAALMANGYRVTPRLDLSWECALRSPNGRVEVDLHRELFPPWLALPFDFEKAWDRRVHIRVAGHDVPTPNREDMLLVLCLSLIKDAAEGKSVLRQLCDIAHWFASQPDIDWRAFERQVRRVGAKGEVALALGMVQQCYPGGIPARAYRPAVADPVPEALIARIAAQLCQDTRTKRPFWDRVWGEHEFLFRVRKHWISKLNLLALAAARLGRVVMVPAGADRDSWHRMHTLHALFLLIRPFRQALLRYCCRYRGVD
jgi:hypothetical protein